MDSSDRGLLDIERFDLEPERQIFHGAIGDMDASQLRGLTTEQKMPYVLRIIGADTISTRLRASLLEVEQSISTWPQLASAVTMGGGAAADVARRILLGQSVVSGRFFLDIEDVIPNTGGAVLGDTVSVPKIAVSSFREMAGTLPKPQSPRIISAQQLQDLVRAASLAPSGGNSQPWKWVWSRQLLHLFLDTAIASAIGFREAGLSGCPGSRHRESRTGCSCRRARRSHERISAGNGGATGRGLRV
jgi:hypothetical protein